MSRTPQGVRAIVATLMGLAALTCSARPPLSEPKMAPPKLPYASDTANPRFDIVKARGIMFRTKADYSSMSEDAATGNLTFNAPVHGDVLFMPIIGGSKAPVVIGR